MGNNGGLGDRQEHEGDEVPEEFHMSRSSSFPGSFTDSGGSNEKMALRAFYLDLV